MNDVAQAAQTIGKFLQAFTAGGGLRLRFQVKLRSPKTANGSTEPSDSDETTPSEPANDAERTLHVEFTGPDTSVLTARNGELLNALEHLATKILRLEPEMHDQVSFDADHFKANRDRRLRDSAAMAIEGRQRKRTRMAVRRHLAVLLPRGALVKSVGDATYGGR